MKTLPQAIWIGIVALGATGCGNMMPPQIYRPSTEMSSLNPRSIVSSTAEESQFRCPNLPNVKPTTPSDFDLNPSVATGQPNTYTVCPSAQAGDYSNLRVHGSTVNSNTICAFPLQLGSDGIPEAVLDIRSGLPVSQCAQTTTKGAFLNFPLDLVRNGFNAIAIVEGPYRQRMQSCILNGFLGNCPPYSTGQFR